MPKLPDYLIYERKTKTNRLEIRKLRKAKEVGISVHERFYDVVGEVRAEYFLNKEDAKELVKALREYFNI